MPEPKPAYRVRRKPGPRKQYLRVLRVRCTAEHLQRLAAYARQNGTDMSTVIRDYIDGLRI
jgi:hypothetical protein